MSASASRAGARTAADDGLFLPDFCAIPVVFAVVVVAQLLAFVFALVGTPSALDWTSVSLTSLFVQWVALVATAALCLLRSGLRRLSDALAGLVALAVVIAVITGVSEAAYRLAPTIGLGPPGGGHAAFLARNVGVGTIVAAVGLRYLYVQHQWRRSLEARAEARVQSLQARMRPHFLFNSLNTIASLARSRPADAEQAVESLADLLRATLRDPGSDSTLGQELELAQRYLEVEHLRLGERLQVEWDVTDSALEATVPPLTVQPLVENAVYHGIESLPAGGRVRVAVGREADRVLVSVSNPVAAGRADRHRVGNRIALDNIRERLTYAYGPRAGLETAERDGRFEARLWVPEAEKET